MASKGRDIFEDAIPESDDDMSVKSSQQAISAKDILRRFGFTHEEIEDIDSVYGENMYQAAETVERSSSSNMGKDRLFKILMAGKGTTQQNVQTMIKKAISDDVSKGSSSESSKCVTNQGCPTTSQQSSSGANSSSGPSRSNFREIDVEVDKNDMPNELKEGQFDIFLFFSEDDAVEALKFKYFLEKELQMKVFYLGDNLAGRLEQFDRLEDAINRSLYMFIFVTKNMIGDLMLKYKHDAALAKSIEENGEFVVPVRAENCQIPFSLQPLTALRVYHIMDELPDDPMFRREGESEKPIDWTSNAAKQIPFVKNQIVKLVRAKERLKKRREQMDEQKKKEWMENEKVRLYKESVDNELKKEQLELERSSKVKEIDENAKMIREHMEMMRQEMEKAKKEEMHNMQYRDMQQSNLAVQIAMLRQMGMNDAANSLQLQAVMMGGCIGPNFGAAMSSGFMPSAAQFPFPSVGQQLQYTAPRGVNPANLVPQPPTVNIQVQQLQNLQVGDQNKVISEGVPPTNINSPMTQAAHSRGPQICPDDLPAQSPDLGEPAVDANSVPEVGLLSEDASSFNRLSEDASSSPAAERELFHPIDETGPTIPAYDQTLVKRQHSAESTVVTSPPMNLQQQLRSNDEGTMVTSAGYSSGASSEFVGVVQSEEGPSAQLGSLSMHHFDSATEHMHQPPGEHSTANSAAQMRNPVSLIEPPSEELDNALSIRSLPCQHGSLHPSTLPNESQFHQSQASVNIS